MAIVTSSHRRGGDKHYFHVACFAYKASKAESYQPNDVFSNLHASRPDDFKDCLILPDLMLTSTTSTAKCEPGFSATNHLKSNLRTILGQNTLSDLMPMHSSDHAMKAYRPNSAISNWFSGAKTKRNMVKIQARFLCNEPLKV